MTFVTSLTQDLKGGMEGGMKGGIEGGKKGGRESGFATQGINTWLGGRERGSISNILHHAFELHHKGLKHYLK